MTTFISKLKNVPILIATTVAVVAALAVCATPAGAASHGGGGGGKPSGGGGSTSSLQLVVLSGSDSVPNWSEDVTFNVSTTATTEPHLDLTCSQGGTLVYSATTGFYASYPWPWTQTMTLSSQMWTGGAAACSASLYMFNSKGGKTVLASLAFPVSA
jgi:hypothetical protein